MEGTRHEKVALIIAAYIIGFTTAFIAFGLTKMNAGETQVLFLNTVQTPQTQTNPVHNFLTSVAFGNDGLYSITSEKDRLLTADKNALGANLIGSAPQPGFYENIIDAEASRDGRFIYYCEQLTAEAENCDPYVYALAEDTLYHVQNNGNVMYPIIESHESMWSGESTLILNEAVSSDPNRPWELSSTETVLTEEISVQ